MSQAVQVFNPQRDDADSGSGDMPGTVSGKDRGVVAGSMARNAIIVGLAFIVSRVLGLGREVILARQFGTGSEMDAYVSAFRIPDLLFLVVMAGSFGAAFIPVFGEYLANGDQERAWRLASAVLTWAGVGVVTTSAVCFLLARPLMRVVAPGFDAATEDIAVNLMRILLLSPVFLGFGIASKGILEAHHQFTPPALAPIVYNIAIIIGALFFVPDYGIYAVGWAVIIGAFGHFLIQVPGLFRARMHFRPTLSRRVEGLSDVVRLLGPRVIGLAAFQANFIAVNAFASTSNDEHVSAINYAWQLLMLPHGVLALSISTVIFPRLAELYSRNEHDAFRDTLDRTMRPLLFLSIPASVGLLLLREPIVRIVFQRQSFDSSSTALVIAPLAWFAIGLVGYALTEVLTRVFYATRDTRTPVVTGVLTVILNLLLCTLFIDSLGYSGLALALSATTACEAIILLLFLRQRIGHVVSPDFMPWLVRVTASSAAMAVVVLVTVDWLDSAMDQASGHPVLAYGLFAYAFVVYIMTFMVVAFALRLPELQMVIGSVAKRLPSPFRRVPG